MRLFFFSFCSKPHSFLSLARRVLLVPGPSTDDFILFRFFFVVDLPLWWSSLSGFLILVPFLVPTCSFPIFLFFPPLPTPTRFRSIIPHRAISCGLMAPLFLTSESPCTIAPFPVAARFLDRFLKHALRPSPISQAHETGFFHPCVPNVSLSLR